MWLNVNSHSRFLRNCVAFPPIKLICFNEHIFLDRSHLVYCIYLFGSNSCRNCCNLDSDDVPLKAIHWSSWIFQFVSTGQRLQKTALPCGLCMLGVLNADSWCVSCVLASLKIQEKKVMTLIQLNAMLDLKLEINIFKTCILLSLIGNSERQYWGCKNTCGKCNPAEESRHQFLAHECSCGCCSGKSSNGSHNGQGMQRSHALAGNASYQNISDSTVHFSRGFRPG